MPQSVLRQQALLKCLPVRFLLCPQDAAPHLRSYSPCATSRHELAWLEARGVPASEAEDMFLVLKRVLSHFHGQLVLDRIVFDVMEVGICWPSTDRMPALRGCVRLC